jgi:Ca2+-binding RTX toxin-like protein
MSMTVLLLLLASGVLLIPALSGDEEEDGDEGGKNEILGGPEDDVVNGTNGNDLIRTFLGNDEIDGNGGNDDIRAGEGNDLVFGGAGLDFIRGGAGDDVIYGEEGVDRIISDSGNDYVDGGSGADVIRGSAGTDTILGGINVELDDQGRPVGNGGAADELSGEDADDLLVAWGGGSTLNGGLNDEDEPANLTNNDTLVAVTGENFMENRTGDNTNIGLANMQDSQVTRAIVIDFDLDDDRLVLTVDHTSTAAIPAGYSPDFTTTFRAGVSTEQGEGTFVEVRWDNPYGAPGETESESAGAFLVGYTPDQLNGSTGFLLRPEVYLTEDASFTDPLATLQEISQLPATAINPNTT